jgi:RNA:NAD 2'-phosphotransferase (TPT1/KptA family)
MKDAKGHGSDSRGAHAEGVEQIGRKLYHVTSAAAAKRIMQEGLVPKTGPRSQKGEPPLVFLSSSLKDAQGNVTLGWLGGKKPQILEVTLPPGVKTTANSIEEYTREPIPPKYIRNVTNEGQ